MGRDQRQAVEPGRHSIAPDPATSMSMSTPLPGGLCGKPTGLVDRLAIGFILQLNGKRGELPCSHLIQCIAG
jgi:hypothetical protein